jgi:hypothetical protein
MNLPLTSTEFSLSVAVGTLKDGLQLSVSDAVEKNLAEIVRIPVVV